MDRQTPTIRATSWEECRQHWKPPKQFANPGKVACSLAHHAQCGDCGRGVVGTVQSPNCGHLMSVRESDQKSGKGALRERLNPALDQPLGPDFINLSLAPCITHTVLKVEEQRLRVRTHSLELRSLILVRAQPLENAFCRVPARLVRKGPQCLGGGGGKSIPICCWFPLLLEAFGLTATHSAAVGYGKSPGQENRSPELGSHLCH